ncbi:response regulator [Candidatus Wolfebacteria bacterium]|nr:response regulator [Candidatus Wolfebacteria bacterium]
MKVAIIEDEEILHKVLTEKFKSEGYEVALAEDGEKALGVIETEKPDMIVLDIILPKKDGFEVLKEIKSNPSIKMIPVIVLSNLGRGEEIKRAMDLGAVDYLIKTQHPLHEVITKVNDYLKNSKYGKIEKSS